MESHKESVLSLWFQTYLKCLYWSISFEKVEPQNSLEFGYGSFSALVSEIAFGFIIDGIHNVLIMLTRKHKEKKFVFISIII